MIINTQIFYKFIATAMPVLIVLTGIAAGYDESDFAVSVESYDSTNVGATHNNPDTALGRPSVDTLYYFSERPVVPLYPANGSHEVVTVGYGGHLILKFDHRVADDLNNPYGVDFIVFGNAWQMIGFTQEWHYGDPKQAVISTENVFNEPGKVSVSQDGVTWYSFDFESDPNVPAADDFAPTLGRMYDESNPYEGYDGWENQWWGEVTDPTVPLDPNLTASDFLHKTLAEVCLMYGKSAGGTGFDLRSLSAEDYESLKIDPQTGRRWIQYIKIECTDPDSIITPEIDAVSDVSACGDYKHPYPPGDINLDCSVDLQDLAILSGNWLECTWKCDK